MSLRGLALRQHLKLIAPMLGIVMAVWAIRILAYEAGFSLTTVRLFSVTLTVQICLVLAVVQIHLRKGRYFSVVMASLLFNLWAQLLICSMLLFAIVTGTSNVFTHPQFAVPGATNLWVQIRGQMTLVLGFNMLFGAATGSLLLFLLRWMLPQRRGDSI